MNEELKIIIRAELEQFKKAMKDAISGIKSVANESKKASKQIDGFTADINQQGKALTDLKRKYVDLAKAHGTESKEAKDAAEAIKKLSAEYKTNKALAANLANKANSFDVSLGSDEDKKNVDATNESMGELQDTMNDIRTLNFWSVLQRGHSGFTEKMKSSLKLSKEYFKDSKNEFGRMGETIKNTFKSFDKDHWFSEWGFDGEVTGQMMIKEFFEGGKLSAQDFSSAMTQAFRGIGEAAKGVMAGIAASAAILIADLLVIIGLTKNALSMAKQIKAMSNEASRAGMTTATFQEWGYVLKQVGIEEDKLTDFTKKLAERQNELRAGSEEVAKAFEEIGLSQEEVLGSSQEELFRKSVEGLQNIENEAERTSASFRIFSDDATDLANVLYLTNQETQSLVDNYYALGGAPSDNLIQKSKILGGSTTNLSYAWQGLRNTLAEWVIPAVIGVVQWLTTAVAYINVFLQGIFGVKAQSKDAAKGIENIGKGTEKVATGANKATKAIKELLRYTMGFDELNVIPKQSSGGSGSDTDASSALGGGYSGSNINPELPVIEAPDLSNFRAWMDEYGSIIQGILTWTLLLGGIAMIIGGFMTGNIPLIIGGFSVAGLGIGIGAAGGEESHWAKLGEAIKKSLKAIGDYFTHVGKEINRWWNDVVAWFQELGAAIKKTWDDILGWFAHAGSEIKRWWGDVCDWFDKALTDIGQFFVDAWNWIVDVWNGAGEWFGNIWEDICDAFDAVGTWFSKIFRDAWQGIKNAFAGVGSFFEGLWNDITEIFSDIGNTIGEAVSGAVSSAVSWVLDKSIKIINGFIKAINAAIDVINLIPHVDIKKLKLLDVPKLATGGIATRSVLANIGENGKEAVLPLENNTGWMDVLAERINRNSPSRIVLMVDGKELGYAAINNINSITRQSGQLQLQLV